MVRFTEKFTCAKAHLFAMVCKQYISDAEEGCNDAPKMTPLFSWLSPYQRVQLTREVMVGLLCPDEPFPPGTVQHLATYYAMVEFLKTQIIVEVDMQRFEGLEDIGEDLMISDQDDRTFRTEEEQQNLELIRDRAEKNKKKLDRRDADAEEEKDAEAEESRRVESEAEESRRVETEEEFDMEETPSNIQGIINTLFAGTPLSREQREQMRKPTTPDEQHTFCWRLLCDVALQEDDEVKFPFPRPLATFCFDFRSSSLQKWNAAIDALFITLSGVEVDNKERCLVFGAIDDRAYADKAQHSRIQAVKKQVSILRKLYESTWDANLLAQDQRCIYAVCSNETCVGHGHEKFAEDFAKELSRQHDIDLADSGNYQERYNIYNAMAPTHQEGLKHPFFASSEECTSFEDCETPVNYTCEFETIRVSCHNHSCWSSENLKSCSKCKVVCYCSRECQAADWPKHKTYCKEMAKLRKDKEAVAAMAKNMR